MPLATTVLITAAFFVTPASVADPLACTDTREMERIRENLKITGNDAQPPRKFAELKEPREVLFGAPPRSATQYETATTYITASCYCDGRAEFDAGVLEPVYWRLDQVKEDASESTRIDLCHKLWDQFEDVCKSYRPEDKR